MCVPSATVCLMRFLIRNHQKQIALIHYLPVTGKVGQRFSRFVGGMKGAKIRIDRRVTNGSVPYFFGKFSDLHINTDTITVVEFTADRAKEQLYITELLFSHS